MSTCLAVSAGQYENARARLDVPNIRVVEMSSDDAWVRDTGPTFVINNSGEVRGVNWDFNAWGGFDGGLYAPWNRDSQVGGKILEIERAPRYRTEGFVLEGGSIHVDGEGTLITTEECLLNRNRNPHLDRAAIEAVLSANLAVDKIIWLPDGLFNDETDGHVDNFCCYVRPGEVLLAWTEASRAAHYTHLCQIAVVWLAVTRLPMPRTRASSASTSRKREWGSSVSSQCTSTRQPVRSARSIKNLIELDRKSVV